MATPQYTTLSYKLITWALFPLAFTYTLYAGLKHKSLAYILQRLSIYKASQTPRPIWCHCASVGEINTALPLLHTLTEQGENLLITTNTTTGYETLTRAKLKNSTHVYLPLDYKIFASRFLRRFHPKLCFIFETELWPNILLTTMNSGIDVAIINGRISNKTLKAPSFMLSNYSRILSKVKKVISSSKENTARFITLGTHPDSIITLDNLKFANLNLSDNQNHTKPLDYPYLLCASTHEGEEQRIIDAWIKHPNTQMGLVIAIRHPQRTNQVIQILQQHKLPYCLHSNKSTARDIRTILIIDTLGELMPFIVHANVVFMGGSLVPVGGHNVIEPAQYKRCILIGPHYNNFKNIVDDLHTQNAIEIVENADQLLEKAIAINNNHDQYKQLGINAHSYIESKHKTLEDYVTITRVLIPS